MALPRKYSLKLGSDFALVKEKGKFYSHSFSGLLVLESGGPLSRFGFLISKRIDPRAVYRNRLKRKLSLAVVFFLPRIKPGFKVVFLPREKMKDQSGEEVKKVVSQLLAEAKLLN